MTDGFSEFAAGMKRPRFEIADASLSGRKLAVGDRVEVEIRVANTGGANGTVDVDLWMDGDRVASECLSVPANATRTVHLEHGFAESGTYELRVNEVALGEVVVEPAEDPVGAADDPTADGSGPKDEGAESDDAGTGDERAPVGSDPPDGSPGLVLFVLLVVLVLAGTAVAVWHRQ